MIEAKEREAGIVRQTGGQNVVQLDRGMRRMRDLCNTMGLGFLCRGGPFFFYDHYVGGHEDVHVLARLVDAAERFRLGRAAVGVHSSLHSRRRGCCSRGCCSRGCGCGRGTNASAGSVHSRVISSTFDTSSVDATTSSVENTPSSSDVDAPSVLGSSTNTPCWSGRCC